MTEQLSVLTKIRRTPYQAIASIFMMFITLFVLSLFLLLISTTTSLVAYFESKPQLTVFFATDKDGGMYVKAQPNSEEGMALCEQALSNCPVEAIGNDV